jgi:hypothetical protein
MQRKKIGQPSKHKLPFTPVKSADESQLKNEFMA